MVAQPGSLQASLNSGEIALEMYGRTEVKQFYSAASRMLNCEPVPQGGARLSPRSRHLSRLRTDLAAIAAGAATLSLGPHSEAATLIEITFTDPSDVSVVVIPALSADVDGTALIQVQTYDGADWHDFGAPQNFSDAAKTLTAALAPGEVHAGRTKVRLRLTAAAGDPVTFVATSMTAYVETGEIPEALRLYPFTFSRSQSYDAAIMPGLIDFFRSGEFVGAASVPLNADQVTYADWLQRFDTLMLHHDNIAAIRVKRDGADGCWPRDAVPYVNIPIADLGGSYDNAIAEVWEIRMTWPTAGSYAGGVDLYLKLSVNGEDASIYTGALGSGWAGYGAEIKAALEALPGVASGIDVHLQVGTDGLTIYYITFSGADNAGANFIVSAQITNTALAAAIASNRTRGVAGGEPIFSADAGYAACATFFNDRLIQGGFASKRAAWLASVSAEYFDLNSEIAAASGALLANLDTDGAEQLHKLARARHLIFFTTDAEYFLSDRAISRAAVPNLVNCSRNGSARGVPIVESDGNLFYVSRNRALIYAMGYDDVKQAYISDPISLLASHIVSGAIDADLQKAERAADASRYFIVRDDGTMTIGVLILNQDVVAFVRWETDGEVKSVSVDGANVTKIAVLRDVDGGQELHLEQLESGLIFDDTISQSFDVPTTTVTGLARHEGQEVWAKADGYVLGPFTVAGGAIELPDAFSVVDVGRWTAPDVRTLPIPNDVAERVVLRRPKRVHTVKLDLINTVSVAVGANGESAEDVPLYRAGDAVDQAPPPYTGLVSAEGLTGFSDEGIVQITQSRPGWLQFRGITIEARR